MRNSWLPACSARSPPANPTAVRAAFDRPDSRLAKHSKSLISITNARSNATHRCGRRGCGPAPSRSAAHLFPEQGTFGGAEQDPHPDSEVPDLGPMQRAVSPCDVDFEDRNPGLFRRPTQPLATWNKCKPEWSSAAVRSEGNRPFAVEQTGLWRRCSCAEHTPAEGSWMAYSGRGDGEASTIASTAKCCVDQLNSPCARWSVWQ